MVTSKKVILLSLPFVPVKWPSLGLSSLKATLSQQGVNAEVDYLSFEAAETFGADFFHFVAEETYGALLGEWIFSDTLFEPGWSNEEAYFQNILLPKLRARHDLPMSLDALIAQSREAKSRAPEFIKNCFGKYNWDQYSIVGFTSTFQQNVASLALAKSIKSCFPETVIVFGGANCEGEMGVGILEAFKFVDVVFSGEGELTFPKFVRETLDGVKPTPRKGIISRDAATGRVPDECRANTWVAPVERLDDIPYPDHSDYFRKQQQFEEIVPRENVNMSFETSRGCWWGQKNHCTFCGLNPNTMSFRTKSPDRALDELLALQAEYPCDFWQVTDDILALPYFKTFLPALAESNPGVRLFYETKANLTKDQLKIMKAARVSHIQPGIESLSENVLKLMRKGISPLQNIRLLKWCEEIGLTPPWNLIWGFPGEKTEDYLEQARFADLISHLEPPGYFGPIRLDRFSPNYDRAAEYGFVNVRVSEQHRYIYDLNDEALSMLAYTFDYDLAESNVASSGIEALRSSVRRWQENADESALLLLEKDGVRSVVDTRPGFGVDLCPIDHVDVRILKSLDPISNYAKLSREKICDAQTLDKRLATFVSRGWVIQAGEKLLSLVVLSNRIKPGALAKLRTLKNEVAA